MRGSFRVLLLAALALGGQVRLAGLEQSLVKRGTPERQGRGWVERREFSAPAREGGRLVLRADSGSVVIKTGAGDRVEGEVVLRVYTASETEARRYFSNYELSVRSVENGGVYVSGSGAGGHRHSMGLGAEFKITAPVRFNLDLETQGGDISLESPLQGEVRATTAGGDIRAEDVRGPLRVETAGGNISLGNIGQHLDARTAGGGVHVGDVHGNAVLETSGGEIVTGRVEGTLRAETAGGDVVIGGASGEIVAQTAGGHIQIGESSGSVRAQTAGGSIRLQGARGRVVVETAGGSIDLFKVEGPIRASTAAGPIRAQFNISKRTFAASDLETSMGDVEVFIPPDLPLTIDAAIESAAGHQIFSDFPLNIQGAREEFVERTIRGRGAVNGGGEVLRIRTVAGNIEIRKLDSQTLVRMKERQDATWKRLEERRAEKEKRRKEREQERRARQRQRE